jgi:hypothetical protein
MLAIKLILTTLLLFYSYSFVSGSSLKDTIEPHELDRPVYSTGWQSLPPEVLSSMFVCLDDLATVRSVCKTWRDITYGENLILPSDVEAVEKRFQNKSFHTFYWQAKNDPNGPSKLFKLYSSFAFPILTNNHCEGEMWPSYRKSFKLEATLANVPNFSSFKILSLTKEDFINRHEEHLQYIHNKALALVPGYIYGKSMTRAIDKEEKNGNFHLFAAEIEQAHRMLKCIAFSPFAPEKALAALMTEYMREAKSKFKIPKPVKIVVLWEKRIKAMLALPSSSILKDDIPIQQTSLAHFYITHNLNPSRAHELVEELIKLPPTDDEEFQCFNICIFHFYALRYMWGEGLPLNLEKAQEVWRYVGNLPYINEDWDSKLIFLRSRTVANPPIPHNVPELMARWREIFISSPPKTLIPLEDPKSRESWELKDKFKLYEQAKGYLMNTHDTNQDEEMLNNLIPYVEAKQRMLGIF